MSDENGVTGRVPSPLGFQARLTGALVVRQVVLLAFIGTLLLGVVFFYNFYGVVTWDVLVEPIMSLKYFSAPAIIVFVYGYVFFIGILFALVPSERSFQFFFYGILFALALANYDHSILDWIIKAVYQGSAVVPNPVSFFKIVLAAPLLGAVIYMHYNILSDDFARRMVRRGIPTEEVARIRPGMFKALVPLLTASSVIAVSLALVGEFSALVFQNHGLLPKIEVILLGAFGVTIAVLLRSILRELWTGDEEPAKSREEPSGPKRT